MELPECPVCLQPYDEAATVPRVLPCGHSACERCLGLLPSPPAHPKTLRCPACNQLVRFPSPLGPKSLPKNIDLLRFCSLPTDSKPASRPESDSNASGSKPEPDVDFIQRPWTEDLLQAWKPWILPPESIALKESSDQTLVLGIHRTSIGCENQQKVSLFPIYVSSKGPKWFQLRYMTRVMESLCKLGDKLISQLMFLLEVCSRQRSGICRVLGLWMNPNEEASALFLVCETFNQSLASVLNGEGVWRLGLETVEKFGFGMVGMELCEVVMSFHSEGVVFGCLDVDCFSFDAYGHCLLNLNNVLLKANRLREGIEDDKPDSMKTPELLSPEVTVALHEGSFSSDPGSDVWSLGCILAIILAGDGEFVVELLEDFHCLLMKGNPANFADICLNQYEALREKVICKLDAVLTEIKFQPLIQMLSSCLLYHLESRPQIRELWCCVRSHFIEIPTENLVASDEFEEKKSNENIVSCLFIGNMGHVPKEAGGVSQKLGTSFASENVPGVGLAGSCGTNVDQLQKELAVGDFAMCQEGGGFQFDTLQGHQDCITGLAVGGGYLFSSSFDKTVSVWSLQDFSHVRLLKGHEHRVMAMVVMDETQPLCISGDSASGIFVWRIDTSFGQELQLKWYEHNDWRYSGIHSMAISGGYLYTGSGDKSIKAWSLQDYSLACTMTGHNSTVSSLVAANGVLYSGSWDGTIRLWCLSDHSLLSVLEDDSAGAFVPILSLSVDHHFLVSAYENGSIKIWKNDAFLRSMKIQDGAIFAVHMDKKWLFTGGWSKSINIQELSENELQMDIRPTVSITCDSVITSLFSWRRKLFAGFSDKEIKVYYYATE